MAIDFEYGITFFKTVINISYLFKPYYLALKASLDYKLI